MSKLQIIYCIAFLSFILAACKSEKEKVLPRDKMVAVLYDLNLAESIYQIKYSDFMLKEQKDALVNNILEKHGITQAQLDSSLVWYSDKAEIYMRVNDSVIAGLTAELRSIESQFATTNLSSSRNSTILPNHIFLTVDQPVLTFLIDSLRVVDYPNFDLEFKTLGLLIDTVSEFSVIYTYLDTVIVDKKPLSYNGLYQSANGLTSDTLKSISGYIYINPLALTDRKALIYDIILKNTNQDKQLTE